MNLCECGHRPDDHDPSGPCLVVTIDATKYYESCLCDRYEWAGDD